MIKKCSNELKNNSISKKRNFLPNSAVGSSICDIEYATKNNMNVNIIMISIKATTRRIIPRVMIDCDQIQLILNKNKFAQFL